MYRELTRCTPHFCWVVEDIQRNGPPLFVIQRYWIWNTGCARFPLNRLRLDPPFLGSSALYRGFGLCKWRFFGFVVCCHEVCRLLSDECLRHRRFYSTFIFTFCSKRLLHPLSWVAPTILHGPPNRASVGRCKIKCCIGLKKLGGKIFSNLQINSGANCSISSRRPGDSSFAQRTRKK